MSLATDIHPECPATAGRQSVKTFWHASAPHNVRKALHSGQRVVAWKAWRKHLRDRRDSHDTTKRGYLGNEALHWGLSAAQSDLLRRPSKTNPTVTREEAQRWLDEPAPCVDHLSYALSAIQWCRELPKLVRVLPANLWWRLLDRLLMIASDRSIDERFLDEEPFVQQVLAGELPLTLAYLFPEIKPCRKALKQARQALSLGLEELLDGDGLVHARHINSLRPLLACWTRCRVIGRRWKQGCWTTDAEQHYHRFVRQAMLLSRRDGAVVFTPADGCLRDRQLLKAALALVGNRQEQALASFLSLGQKKRSASMAHKLPKGAEHSEWAAVAVLRPNWSRSSPRLTALYPATSCQIELACGRDVLLSGEWKFDLQLDGAPVTATSDWSENCWVSDADIDYLELEIELNHGLRIQRHLAVARQDRIALLADAVLGTQCGRLDYRSHLPLGSGVTFRRGCETREGMIVGHKPRATVLPLDLPEWLEDRQRGELTAVGGGLHLRQTAQACSLFAPLLLDLNPQRFGKRLTWRQLTVAESLQPVSAEVAVGYRVAIGSKQWLLYRSMTLPQNRTVLGHNLSTEMLLARFDGDGEVDSLIEIE